MFLAETLAKGSFVVHHLAGDAQSYLNMSLCKFCLHEGMCFFFLRLKKFILQVMYIYIFFFLAETTKETKKGGKC